ncbi:hypothetical protein CLPU_5c02020 [Gottschalkia purinilytica]|uniref:DUF3153 domain-containing protein n=1 Tax=Gottschalkia purinilytica TaxID=1503 RepID=A0A0L0WBV8_GOTPU|nr:hypothetical protein [Gottschalkia purinilytica]KNF08895.1 hypothetical protein CLPU_5c02020 [Gottschalkia purinilytica]
MRKYNRAFIIMIIMCLISILSGCTNIGAEGTLKAKVNINGTVDLNLDILANKKSFGFLNDNNNPIYIIKDKLEEKGFKVSNLVREEKMGIHATKHVENVKQELSLFKNMEVFASENSNNKKNEMFRVEKGWFKTKYTLDANINVTENIRSNGLEEILINSILSDVKLKLILDLPIKPSEHNASIVKQDGKVLEWDIVPTTNNKVLMKAESLNVVNTVIAIVSFVILFIVLFFLFKKMLHILFGNNMKN